MGKSLQEQLKSLGVVGKGQSGKKKKPKQTQVRQKQDVSKRKPSVAPESGVREERDVFGKQVKEKRKIREREDEAARAEKLRQRAAEAQVKELVEGHRLERPADGVSYRFSHQGTIRRFFVTQEMADKLSNGMLGIAIMGDAAEIIPAEIARKVKALETRTGIIINEPDGSNNPDSDDPYSDYQVPDDLVW